MARHANSGLKIGALAEKAGVHHETVRYYQRVGLMPTPRRTYGSVRRYDEDALRRLRFIKRAQALGFSLEEVKRLVELSVGEHCAETRRLADEKRRLIERKIADLSAIKAALDQLIRGCDSGRKGRGCPVIEAMSAGRRG